ncbi:MAG: ABC transporter permease [Candidatus Zeuxoniibacter abyssi]|nr:MAG: ABC transporter permease [Candidatus Persebacteraceae bacterium AB1(2)]
MGASPVLWLTIFFIVPLLYIFFLSFSEKEGIIGHQLTWSNAAYLRAFEPIYLEVLAKSFFIAACATVVCLLVGYPIALAIAFAPQRLKIPLLLAVTLPFWINIIVRTYSLIAVFRTRGFLNFSLEWFWDMGDKSLQLVGVADGLGAAYAPLELLYTNTAVVFGIVYVFLPFMILPVYAAMERFDRLYLEAALDLGAGHWRTLFSVLLPLTLPGVASGVMIVFVPALGAFFIAEMLGGTDSQLIGNVIDRQFKGANNWPFGSALSFLLMYLTFTCIVLRAYMLRRKTR